MKKIDYKALTPKTDKGTYIIRISDYYPENCSEQKYTEVDEKTLDYLIAKRREEKKKKEADYRALSAHEFDEVKTGVLSAKYLSESIEDAYFRNADYKVLWAAFMRLSDIQRRRIMYHHCLGYTYTRIAEIENVKPCSVQSSVDTGLNRLRKILGKSI